jgi:Glycosyltransferase family 87
MKWIALLGAGAACALWMYFIPWDRVLAGQNDFLGQYCGARLVGTPQLHDPAACEIEQQRAVHLLMPAVVFIRPDYYAVLLKPLGALPYRTAYLIFTLLNLAALMLALYLVRDRKDILLLGAVSIPIITSFLNGQDLPLLLAALLCAVALDRQGRGFLAGLTLALCTIKPHLFVLAPIALIAGRRWRMLAGASAGVSALVTLAAVFQGWNWIGPYVALLRTPLIHPMPFPMPNLRGLASVLGSSGASVEVVGTCLVVGWFLVTAVRSKTDQFEHTLGMAIAAGLLVSHHLGLHDCSMLLAVAALASMKSRLYQVAVVLAAPFSYFIALLAAPISALPALALAGGFFATSKPADAR